MDMDLGTKYKLALRGIATTSLLLLIGGLVYSLQVNLTDMQRLIATIAAQLGGAFFFTLSVGWMVDWLKRRSGYSELWMLSREFSEAGLLKFYSSRNRESEEEIEAAFNAHVDGEIQIAGASLRLFLASNSRFHEPIRRLLADPKRDANIRVIYCSPDGNNELPVRSFVEERASDGEWKVGGSSDWSKLEYDMYHQFLNNFPQNTSHPSAQLRVITDLHSTRAGIRELNAKAMARSSITSGEYHHAPYFTMVMFPDKVFYTPNILSQRVPASLPLLVFHRRSEVYELLYDQFRFMWAVSTAEPPRPIEANSAHTGDGAQQAKGPI